MKDLHIDGVSAKNFFSWEEVDISFPSRGMVHFAGPNGAGKSTAVMEIPYWVFFEKTVRAVSANEVIRAKPTLQDSCSASVRLRFDGKKHTVTRYRNHADYGRALHVDGKPAPMTWFQDTTGLDIKSFQNSCFFSADEYDFPLLGPQAQAQVVERLFNLSYLDKAKKIEEARVKSVRYSLEEAETAVRTLRGQLDDLEEDRALLISSSELWSQGNRKEYEEGQRRALEAYLSDRDEMRACQQLTHLASWQEVKAEANAGPLRKRIVAADKLIEQMRDRVVGYNTKERIYKSQLEALLSVQGKCPTCGSQVSSSHKVSVEKEAKLKLSDNDKKRQICKGKLLKKIELAHKLRSQLPQRLRWWDSVQPQLDSAVRNMERSWKAYQRTLKPAPASNPHLPQIKRIDKKIEDVTERLASAKKRAKKFSRKVNYHLAASRGFQRMRLWKLRGVTDEINKALDEAMDILSGGMTRVTIRTVQQLKNKELREKYGVEIVNSKGGNSFKSLSKGEQGRVKVAFMLAFSSVSAALSDVRVRLTVLDEVLSGLDKDGVEAMLDALRAFSLDRTVALLSADERVASYPVSLRVTARKGSTGISELV